MLSARLVHLIETHGETIVDRAVAQIRRDANSTHDEGMLDFELRELGEGVACHLGNSLSTANGTDVAVRCERLGKICWDREIPLADALRGLSLLREKMLDFAQEHLISNSSIELYAEEELDRRLGRFFDRLAIYLVRGFEQAVRKPESVHTAIH